MLLSPGEAGGRALIPKNAFGVALAVLFYARVGSISLSLSNFPFLVQFSDWILGV